MKSLSVLSIFVAGACIAGPAKSPGLPLWQKEPSAVLGIELGAPLPDAILECEKPFQGNGPFPGTLCVHGRARAHGEKMIPLWGLPFLGIGVEGGVSFHGDKVTSIYFDVQHDDYEKFKRVLLDRYGPPSASQVTQVTANSGAVFPSETLTWVGQRVGITSVERSGQIDHSAVVIMLLEFARLDAEEQRAREKAAASKL